MDPRYTVIPGLNDNPGGRPTEITMPFGTSPDGDPWTKPQAIIHFVRQVEFLETACALAGVPHQTARRWFMDGARANVKPAGQRLTVHEKACQQFREDYIRAKAEREKAYSDISDELIRGGRRIAKVHRHRVFAGPNDTTGTVTWQTEVTTTLPPDAAHLRWRMAVSNGPRYSQKFQISATDEGLELPEPELRDALAEKAAAWLDAVVVSEETRVEPVPDADQVGSFL